MSKFAIITEIECDITIGWSMSMQVSSPCLPPPNSALS